MRRRPLLTLPPWRRAPALLARSPGVLAAIAGAGFLLSLAVASRPVFLGSAASAAVDSDITEGCRYEVGLRVTTGRIRRAAEADQADVARIPLRTRMLTQAARGDGVQPLITTVSAGNGELVTAQGEQGQGVVQLFSRTGAFTQVHVRAQDPGVQAAHDGLWVPDTTAALLHIAPGQTVDLDMGNGHVVPTRIAAVFDDLTYVERPRFWCSMYRSFEPLGSNPLPPVALADQGTLLRLLGQSSRRPPSVMYEVPPADGLSVPRAQGLADRLNRVFDDLQNDGPFAQRFGFEDGLQTHMALPGTIDHAHLVARQVRTTADTVGAASTAIALVAVAGAGFFWVDRRRAEVALLLAKGVSPSAIAAKAALESALPLAVGGLAGTGAAVAAVQAAGPSPAFDGQATATAAALAALAAVSALALLAVAAAVRTSRAEQRMAGVPQHRRGLVPFALAAAAAVAIAAALAIEHATGYTQLNASRHSSSLGLIVVVFPLLVLVGGGALIAVVGHWLLPRTRRLGGRWPAAPYLAVRRVATAGPLALALTAGSVLSVGILLYASVVAASARATVVAKASIGVGSDMAVFLADPSKPALPPDLARRATPVLRTAADVGEDQVDVLGVDPATFGRGAFYDRAFGGKPLHVLLDKLKTATNAGSLLNVILADGVRLPSRFDLPTGSGPPVNVRVVARAAAFPGMSGESPLLIADEDALRAHGVTGNRQLWVKGSTQSVLAQLDRARIPVVTT
ncbi:MAG TPA: FtsX-like permease family protein, partial [Acidimicrobiales bacterium]|nr:FtsX-like permease family protein [Acidimicrobiales bacterium]